MFIKKMNRKRCRRRNNDEETDIRRAKVAVYRANKLVDPLEYFPDLKQFNNKGLVANLAVHRVTDLDDETKSWIFNLTKRNMKKWYEECSWGWNEEAKQKELTENSAWYLIVTSIDGSHLGFSHFRFDVDFEVEVLYCYELQLEAEVQGKGLGKFMMNILEQIAFKNRMRKVVLTVLKNNPCSDFFRSIGYDLDDTSPFKDESGNEPPYEILSKMKENKQGKRKRIIYKR